MRETGADRLVKVQPGAGNGVSKEMENRVGRRAKHSQQQRGVSGLHSQIHQLTKLPIWASPTGAYPDLASRIQVKDFVAQLPQRK